MSDVIAVFLQEEIVLVGHSAGAHLCVMAVLELIMKRLIHTPLLPLAQSVGASTISESISFEDRHFDGSSCDNGASSGEVSHGENGATGVTSGGGDVRLEPASTTTSFIFVEGQEQRNTDSFCVVDEGNSVPVTMGGEHSDSGDATPDGAIGSVPSGQVEEECLADEEVGREGDADEGTASDPLLAVRTERLMSQSQRQLKDLLNSVKAVVGAFAILMRIANKLENSV